MIKIDKLSAEKLHKLLIAETGGTDGLRDESLLESALHAPYAEFGRKKLFPSVVEKAARLGIGLVQNHAFFDGNKRIGVLAFMTFLEVNGLPMNATDDEIVTLGLSLASGKTDYDGLLSWINKHI